MQGAGLQAVSFATADPRSADVAAAEVGNPNTTSAIGAGNNVFALLTLGVGYSQNGSGAPAIYRSAVDLGLVVAPFQSQPLKMALLNPVVTGSGFDMLQLTITKQGAVLETETFSDLAAAILFFSDHVFEFGPIDSGVPFGVANLSFTLEATVSGKGDSFRADIIAAAVPEPSTIALLSVGAFFLGSLLRRRWLRHLPTGH